MSWFNSMSTRKRFLFSFILATLLGIGAGYIGANQPAWILLGASTVAILIAIYGGNTSANAINGLIRRVAEATDQLAQGNVNIEMVAGVSYEARELNRSFAGMINAIKALVSDEEMVTRAVANGDLRVRADAGKHNGEYKTIIEGLNTSLDAIIAPMSVTAEYLERIGRGDIPAKITDHYNGGFNEIKNNINACIDGLDGLVECSKVIAKMAINDYTTKVEGNYQGIFKLIAENLNQLWGTLNNILTANEKISVGDLTDLYNAYITIGRRCEEDKLIPSYLKLIENVQALVKDSAALGEAAVAGKLDYRADAGKHLGEFRQVIDGFNFALDAVIGPLNVAAEYVERISKGDIPERITDNYNGDFNEIKNNLNTCIDAVNALVTDVYMLEQAAIKQEFGVRADASCHQGDFRQIVAGVNQTLDTVVDKIFWYESILDSLPWPLSVTDLNMQWTFINKAVEDILNVKRHEMKGKHCSNWNANICNTENCGITALRRNQLQTYFEQNGLNFQVDTTYIKNARGENIGHIEIVQDITAKMQVSEFQKHEIDRVVQVLGSLAKGDLGFDLSVAEGNEYTREVRENFILINDSLFGVKTALNDLVDDANMLAKAAVEGKLDTRADAGKHDGDFRAIVEGVNATLDAVIGPLNVAAEYVERISKGDIPPKITDTYYGDFNEIKNNLNGCIDTMEGLLQETNGLIKATQDGKLDTRGDAQRFQGGWGELVGDINELIDAFVAPINVTAEYVERISRGEIPPKITDTYKGDFNEIKNNLNQCIDGLGGLIECCDVLKKMAVNDYTSKVEGHYQGVFAETAEGVNTVRTRLLVAVETNVHIAEGDFAADLEAFRKIGRRSEADRLIPSYIMSMENIQRLVKDAEMLSQAAIAGKLDLRADAAQHRGEYRKVIEGFNNTLDAVIGPLNVAAEYLERIANGNPPSKITDNYNGDFNEIKNNLNTCIDVITILVEEIGVAINASIEGRLDQRANAARTTGAFYEILSGVNATMDALTAPINEAILVIGEWAQGWLNVKMTGDYKGDNAKLKEALNSTIAIIASVIGETSDLLGEMSNGNLAISIDRDYPGDVGKISTALKHIIQSLNEIMGDINHAAERVANESGQVSNSSQALAQGANEQASAIEQLTSAVTEMAAQTRQNAANANQANELALNARENAAQGNERMKEMLDAMEGINDSSANISKIIKVIDEIAFQTNILALNAAVEAARAGQHGKGFAVVAEEVRNLAARSASAAKETTDLIEGSIRKVQTGTQIAHDTARALDKIVDEVSKAAALVGDITVASNEQATGIAQVDQGISQVSLVVQTNSATAQQSAAASEELSNQAEDLKRNVAAFKLKGGKMSSLSANNYLGTAPGPKRHEVFSEHKSKITLDDGNFGKY